MYTITNTEFLEIMDRYPEIRRQYLIRSCVRRAHFIRMLNETKNIHMLMQK